MRLRLLAVLVLGVLLAPAWAQLVRPARRSGVVPVLPGNTSAPVIGRQQITTLTPGIPMVVHDQRINRMRITTLQPVLPAPVVPAVPAMPSAVGAAAPATAAAPVAAPPVARGAVVVPGLTETVLTIQKCTCGRVIDDAAGRRWHLVHGSPDWSGAEELAGWMLPTETGVHFFGRNGRLYRQVRSR